MNNIKFFKGFIVGIIAPLAAFLVYTAFFTKEADPLYTYSVLVKNDLIPHALSLSLLINLLIFFMNIKKNKEIEAKGILGATFFYGLIIIILKFI
tara:strand:+ start:412 stop:696 length:285 start_codon:yes stop_codon:yes gene_type:complete